MKPIHAAAVFFFLCLPAIPCFAGAEPTVTREEAALIDRAVAISSTNRPAAAAWLAERNSPRASAALDFTAANILFQEGDMAGAQAGYEAALAKHPDFTSAWRNLGQALLAQNRNDDAARAFATALRLAPSEPQTLLLLGFAHLGASRAVAAESAFRQALAFAPDEQDALRGLLQSLSLQQRHEETAALASELAARHPARGEYWALRASSLMALGREREAAAALAAARKLGIADTGMLLSLADLCAADGLHSQAASIYSEALRAADADPRRLIRAAASMAAAGAAEEARTLLDSVVKTTSLVTEDRTAAARVGIRIAVAEGKRAEAAEACRAFLREHPLDGETLILLGGLEREAGRTEDAVLCYERAARIRGFEGEALLRHAEMEAARGRYGRAAELIEAARVFDSRPEVDRYLEQMRRMSATM
ncbi:MAG: tetratricopeptide repeat protein [Lentisphaerae bacterium]|nr:tetratricopeptide repeat protein [Lentisphaerota bacterium]